MATPNENLLRLRDVIARVGIQKSQIYKLMELDEFPKSVKLSYKVSCWVASEIDEWIETKKNNVTKRRLPNEPKVSSSLDVFCK